MRKTPWYIWALLFASILFFRYLHKELEEKRNPKTDPKTLIWEPPPNDGKMYRGGILISKNGKRINHTTITTINTYIQMKNYSN